MRSIAGLIVLVALVFTATGSRAEWRPVAGQRFDIQLTVPYDLARAVDVVVLEPFGTPTERVAQLHARKATVICYLSAGKWQNWRFDAQDFPAAALGRSVSGRPGERWLDIRDPSVAAALGRRLDLCRARGFDGVLFADVDGYKQPTGFPLTADQQMTFNRVLAAGTHARGLAAGINNDLGQAAALVGAFDFLVAECVEGRDCRDVRPFLEQEKPVYLIAYTNRRDRMATYCRSATEIGAPLIFKTSFLNGKLHYRCGR